MSTTQTTSSTDATPKAGAVPVRAPKQERPCSCGGGGGECETCKKKAAEPILQRKAAGPARASTAPPSVNRVLDSPGRPLDAPARSFMEPRFGRDFGGVRVHTDPAAAESARAVDAHAYTVGQHIVFDSGKYDPHSAPGRNLLAHELAHTVQQHGAGPASPMLRLGDTPEYNHLENEASRVAQSVVNHSGSAPLPPPAVSRSQPVLSRAKKTGATAQSDDAPKEETSQRDWVTVKTANVALTKAGVARYATPGPQDKNGVVAVDMADKLMLPDEKGPVLKMWKDRASAGALEAIVLTGGDVTTKSGLKQVRPNTDTLRRIWLQKVGWLPENADQHWKDAGGDPHKKSYDPPQAGKKTCQVDHILELQFEGGNNPENLQMLDGEENQESGRNIFRDLKAKAEEIQKAFKTDKINVGGAQNILFHYSKVDQADTGASWCKCCKVEASARKFADVSLAKGESISGDKGTPYPLLAGSAKATIIVDEAKEKKTVPLEKSALPENKQASTLVSGFDLIQWNRVAKGGGTVSAEFDLESRFPSSLKKVKNKPVTMVRHDDGTLKLAAGHPEAKFHFNYLSEGNFSQLKMDDDGSLTGTGTITPSFSFLPKFDIRLDKDKIELAKAIPKDKLKLPIPGVKINKAEILLQIAPEFKPAGEVEFALDAGKRHLLDGKVNVTGDEGGLVMQGDVQVSLPGVDNAAGHIEYRNREWSGKAEISAAQLQSKLKYIKGGSLVVIFNDHGMSADGKVQLKFPGVEEAEAQLLYESSRKQWMFKGKAIFKPPGLEETEINIFYDGEHFEGKGKTGFTFHGIHGDVSIVYRDEKLSGEGALTIDKGKAKGSIHVKMRDVNGHPVYSGDGTISYQIRDDLIATGGIEINEKQEVRLKGELAFPKPVQLFGALKGDYEIFDVGVSIPIPGASIGPIGLKARIDGSLSAGYQVGPGELRNTKISAAFNPLEDKPDVDVEMTSTLYVGGSAYISGKIEGSIVLDAVVASVRGGLAVTARASLDGHASSEVHLHYQKGKFEADANFELLAALALSLALDAFVEAEAGVWRFKVKTRKDWNLASFHYDTGLQFGMKLKKPIHYSSDEGVKLPSADDIEWIKPDIHPVDMLEKIFAGGGTEKEE